MNLLSLFKTKTHEHTSIPQITTPDVEVTHIIRCMNCSRNFPLTTEQYRNMWAATYAREKQLGLSGQGDLYRVLKENAHCCGNPDYYFGVPLGKEKSWNYWKNGGTGLKQSEL